MTDQLRTRSSSLEHMVNPASVAVIGASSSRQWATGNQVIRNLHASGYRGRVEVVNPSGGLIEGINAVTAAGDAESVDLTVVAVAPRAVMSALQAAHEAGSRAALVMSVGMSESQLEELASFSRSTGLVVHGPNCMGVINVADGVMLWADEGILTGLPKGPVALISQSGSGAIFVSRSMTGVGFSHIISTGSEAATTTADYIDFLVDDDGTDVIGIIVESIGSADHFARAVARARDAGKPVVALKVGRSSAGALATVAHTGAMLTEDSIVSAYFDRIGVPLVADYDELAATLEMLAHLRGRTLGEARIAAITISGGQAALTADLAERAGAVLAPLSASTRAQLSEALPGAGINNPLDAGGSETVEEGWYAQCLDLLAQDPAVDVVLVITDSQATLNDIEISYEDEIVADARQAALRHSKPFVMASSSSLSIHPTRVSTQEDGYPVIRGIGNALVAIVGAAIATAPSRSIGARPSAIPAEDELNELRGRVRASAGRIDNALGAQLLSAYGIATPPSTRTDSLDEAVDWADSAGYPVVLKIDSPDIPHRTEVGGVIVGIASADELRGSWGTLFDRVRTLRPDARLSGAELQVQLTDGIEAIVGAASDPAIGATVGVGMGGVLVELWNDTQSLLAPASHEAAVSALSKTRLRHVLDGYRGLNPVIDDRPLIDIVVRASWIMHDFRGLIAELEANPVLIDPRTGGAYAVDVLLVPVDEG